MLLGNSFGQTVHTHHTSVHQAAKLVAALLRVVEVTAGLVESNGSLPPGISMIVIRQKSPNFVYKNYKTGMSVELNILCVVWINIQCI